MNPLWLASILLATALSSYTQQPCTADPNASKNESIRFDNEEFSSKQQEVQANTDYENAKLRCRDSQTVAKPKATREKAGIDSLAAVEECNITGQTPAEKQESLRHFHAEIDIKKKLVDVNTSYANNKLDCASKYPHDTYESSGSTDESRRTCLKNNEKSYATK